MYTMGLERDGRAAMQLDCNRATGTWTAVATGPESRSFCVGGLVTTRAFCPQPSMDQQIARQAEYVRSYMRRDGSLYLNLMAGGGTYVWEPAEREEERRGQPRSRSTSRRYSVRSLL